MASLIEPIVIVGGGPVGATFALSLPINQPVTLLEAREQGASHNDTRALALSHGSRLILEKMGIWKALSRDAVAINTIHISQKGGFGRTILNAREHDLPSLGTVLPYGKLNAALSAEIAKRDNINTLFEAVALHITPAEPVASVHFLHKNQQHTMQSPLIVVADGGRSLNEIAGIQKVIKEYGDDALVAKVRTQLPHNHIAYERFTPQGPIALLPNAGEMNYSLVWTGKKAHIEQLLALSEVDLLQALHAAFGDRVGQFFAITKPLSFPLRHATLKPSTAAHVAVIGNAAQTMHPVAGQGFNVGMRDAMSLSHVLAQGNNALGSEIMLRSYQQTRTRDTRGSLLFTDFLVNTFGSENLGVGALRGLGLGLLNQIKPAKKLLVDRMSFGR